MGTIPCVIYANLALTISIYLERITLFNLIYMWNFADTFRG